MTTEARSCALLAGLAALQDPPGWTGRPVHCQDRDDVLYRWPDDALTAPTYLAAARSYLLGEATPSSLGERGRSMLRLLCEVGQRWHELSHMSNRHKILWLTREILLTALAARWAAIEGDHAAVDDFTRNVLGHADVVQRRDAVISGLLGDWVDRLGGYLTDPELLAILRAYTAAERRRWTETWEHRFGGFQWRAPDGTVRAVKGKRVWLLETPNRDCVTVRDVYPDKPDADALALDHDFTDPRIDAVLRGLDPTEAAVANLWASRKATWADAALDLGLPAAYGDKVRRKLSHVGARHTQRALAAAEVTR